MFPSESYDPAAALKTIEQYKCTALYGVNTMFIAEMNHKNFKNTNKASLK